jgi:LysM repeat protein
VHIVAQGESLYDISQAEAIRLDSLLEYNNLHKSAQPPVGEKLYLQGMSPLRTKM